MSNLTERTCKVNDTEECAGSERLARIDESCKNLFAMLKEVRDCLFGDGDEGLRLKVDRLEQKSLILDNKKHRSRAVKLIALAALLPVVIHALIGLAGTLFEIIGKASP